MSAMLSVPTRRGSMACRVCRRNGKSAQKNPESAPTDKTKTSGHDFKRPMKRRRSKRQPTIVAVLTQMKPTFRGPEISLNDLDRLVSKTPDVGSCFKGLDLDLFDLDFLEGNMNYDLRCCEGVPPLPNLPNVGLNGRGSTDRMAVSTPHSEKVAVPPGDNGSTENEKSFKQRIQKLSSWKSVKDSIPLRGRHNNILASLSITDFPNVQWKKGTIAEFKTYKKKANNRLSATKSKVKQENAGRNLLSCAVEVLGLLKATDRATSPEVVRLRKSVDFASIFFK
jgi:hypothetical protein